MGGTFDKPGQAVRGVIAHQGVSSLKHLNPYARPAWLLSNERLHDRLRPQQQNWPYQQKRQEVGCVGHRAQCRPLTVPLIGAMFGAKHAVTPIDRVVEETGPGKTPSAGPPAAATSPASFQSLASGPAMPAASRF
jgi:hypothetical protein